MGLEGNEVAIQPDKIVQLDAKRKDLLRKHFGKELSQEELELFAIICDRTGLDPFVKQIYPVKRKVKQRDGSYVEKMVIQVGIDGLRLIAERTGCYSPGREPSFIYDGNKRVVASTAYIKKMTSDGTWHEVSATAFMSEYQPKSGNYGNFWDNMPHVMLSKCAESLAIRRAFPSQTSKIYTPEEMEQSEIPVQFVDNSPLTIETNRKMISDEQATEIKNLLGDDIELYKKILIAYKVNDLTQISEKLFDSIIRNIKIKKAG